MKYSLFILFLFIPLLPFAQQNSVLSSGEWYKIAVEETGVYRITYDDLVSYGIDLNEINPRHIALYGNPAGMLPESAQDPYYTDLQQMAIQVVGEDDGSFDPGDYILFFGHSPNIWTLDAGAGRFHYTPNIYSDKTYYFLTFGQENGKRIETEQSTEDDPTGTPGYFDYLYCHQEELVNPGKTGKRWLGESFRDGDTLEIELNTEFISHNPNDVYLNLAVAAKSFESCSFSIKWNDDDLKTIHLPSIDTSNTLIIYKLKVFDTLCAAEDPQSRITLEFESPDPDAVAWLDYVEMNMKHVMDVGNENQLLFRTAENTGTGDITEYVFHAAQPESMTVWNVTDLLNVKTEEITFPSSDTFSFRLPTDNLLEFIAFTGQEYFSPEFAGTVTNQNLHAIEPPQLLIITHPDFLEQAQELAAFHEENDNLSTAVCTTNEIYNEFSSGAQDVTALRNFVRYMHHESVEGNPKYLLLFGDASYDYKDRVEGNTNFVPVYESRVSSNMVSSSATDHYIGMEDMNNSGGGLGSISAVGRLPVKTQAEADIVLSKIQRYYLAQSLGNWKNESLFIGDAGDNNLHMHQADKLVDTTSFMYQVWNNTKCYLDFYETQESGNGQTNPEARALIDKKMNSGVFYVNYTGHGGAEDLSSQNIVDSTNLQQWHNTDYLPVWVTASGGVLRFDDPETMSLSERILLKNDGGSIGFIGNTRPNFSSVNFSSNLKVVSELLGGEITDVRLGDLIFGVIAHSHNIKFNLLGDPALKLSFPEFNIQTTTLNGVNISAFNDTIPPGGRITLEGIITDRTDGSIQTDFNGTVHLKIYAPPFTRTTLGENGDPVEDITVQDSVLSEYDADVIDGAFLVKARTPYAYYEGFGPLRFSWYADNGETDASGSFSGPVFGGEPNAIHEFDQWANDIKVYPTPFYDYLNICLPGKMEETIRFSVSNLLGADIYAGQIDGRLPAVRINLQHLSKGMYILHLENDKFRKSFKIIKN